MLRPGSYIAFLPCQLSAAEVRQLIQTSNLNWYCRVCRSAEKCYKVHVTAYKYGEPRHSTEAFYFILQKIIERRRRQRLSTCHHWTCGHGENQLPSKVVVEANDIYHVDNVSILPLRFSASSLFFFFLRGQTFMVRQRVRASLWIWLFPLWRHLG